MIKVARKPSSDPVQEKLRQAKATWNKEVSMFVNDLIHFKKNMNGWPSKFFHEKSSIKDPIPANPATIIGELSSKYNEIVQQGNEIVKQQLEYSKTRKKRQMKQLNLPLGQPSPEPYSHIQDSPLDLSKQLSLPMAGANFDYNFIAEASNPVTRFFTRLLTPTMGSSEGARIRKYRLSLLEACVLTFKALEKFQVEIVKSSDVSLTNSNAILHKIWKDWDLLVKGFSVYRKNMPNGAADEGGIIASKNRLEQSPPKSPDTPIAGDYDHDPKPGEGEGEGEGKADVIAPVNDKGAIALANLAVNDCKSVINNPKSNLLVINQDMFKNIINLYSAFKFAKDKQNIAIEIVKEYKTILNAANAVHNSSATSFAQLLKILIAQNGAVKTSSQQMEKVAQDFLKKWLGKTKHQYWSGKTSAYRIDMYKMAEEMRKIINSIMDSIEKGMNVEELAPLIEDAHAKISSLRGLMRPLSFSVK